MYSLVKAIGKDVANDNRWVEIDAGDILISTLFKDYLGVQLVLKNPFLPKNVTLRLDDIRLQVSGSSATVNQFLISNGNKTLPTQDREPTLKRKYVTYKDAVKAGYKINPTHPVISPDADIPVSERTWLFLTKPNLDNAFFVKSCLVSVNGFFHYLEGNKDGIWIKDGNVSRTMSNEAIVGIHNFQWLGSIKYVPITESMIYKQVDAQLYKDRMCFDIGEDITNKTVMLVLGGYLHILDKDNFYRIGDNLLELSTANLPLIERYHESMPYIDTSSLDLELTTNNPSQISVSNFLSDASLVKYATLSQSFFVILDNTEIFVEREVVKLTPTPGTMLSYVEPIFPVISGVGRVAEYWSVYEDGQWALTTLAPARDNRLYDTVPYKKQLSLADSRITQNPTDCSKAYFLKIGTDV